MQTWVLLPEADRAEVSRFAKNFLPILFNLYGQPVAAGEAAAPRRAVLETIKTYLTITEAQVSAGEGGMLLGLGKVKIPPPGAGAGLGTLHSSCDWAGGPKPWGPTQELAAMVTLFLSPLGLLVGEWLPGKSHREGSRSCQL